MTETVIIRGRRRSVFPAYKPLPLPSKSQHVATCYIEQVHHATKQLSAKLPANVPAVEPSCETEQAPPTKNSPG